MFISIHVMSLFHFSEVPMVSESKLRIKFGDHEFEIEGPAEHVERQFETFKRMVLPEPESAAPPVEVPAAVAGPVPPPLLFNKIMRTKGPVVSLSVKAKINEAILAILLGQRNLRQNNSVSGMEVMNGLRESGLNIPRADIILAKYAEDGTVVAAGRRKFRRYRLSTDGIVRAEQIVRHLISQVP
jgi:hypothetical protein